MINSGSIRIRGSERAAGRRPRVPALSPAKAAPRERPIRSGRRRGPEDVRAVTANLSVGARLLASAVAFVFVSFVFAFFYLRAVNSNDLLRPAHVNPLPGFGIAVLVCVLAAAVIFDLARRSLVGGTEPGWRVPRWPRSGSGSSSWSCR